jgi:hypothetical protein
VSDLRIVVTIPHHGINPSIHGRAVHPAVEQVFSVSSREWALVSPPTDWPRYSGGLDVITSEIWLGRGYPWQKLLFETAPDLTYPATVFDYRDKRLPVQSAFMVLGGVDVLNPEARSGSGWYLLTNGGIQFREITWGIGASAAQLRGRLLGRTG